MSKADAGTAVGTGLGQLIGLLIVLSAGCLPSLAYSAVTPLRAEFLRSSGLAGVSLHFPSPVKYKVFALREPNRLVVDLDGVVGGPSLDRLVSGMSAGDPEIAQVRVGHPAADQTRIVFDFKGEVPKVETTAEPNGNGGQRLLLKWASSGAKMAQAAPAAAAAGRSSAADPKAKSKAAGEWTLRATPQLVYGRYSKSAVRDSFTTAGGTFDAQYGDRGGFAVGATHTRLTYSDLTPALEQNAGYLSGRASFTPDRLPGTLTARADIHRVNNTDPSNETNQVRVVAPQLSFLSTDKAQYFDLGYAYSRYGESSLGKDSLAVRQWTPTVGFALNQGADWLQLRLYDISFQSSARTQDRSGTDALEGKWTHNMTQQRWVPEQIQFSALVGRRLYAVDSDTALVYNLADMQTGAMGVGARWKVAPSVQLQLNGGYSRYESQAGGLTTNYSGSHVYTGINAQW